MDKNSWNILQNISRDAEFVEQYIFLWYLWVYISYAVHRRAQVGQESY